MMKRKKITAAALAAVLSMGLILAGCSNKEEEPEEEPEEPAMQEIGDTSASLETELTDELGGGITGLSVKSPEKAAYPANFMLAGQQIENGETVKFYYKPQTSATEDTVTITDNSEEAEGTETAEEDKDAALLPGEEAVGYWNMAGSTDTELTIWDVTDDVVTFRLWWKDQTKTRDLMTTFNSGNTGTFAGVIGDDSMISGTVTFTETAVTLDIEQCTFEGLALGDSPLVFDEKHAQSWEYADSYESTGEEGSEAAAEEAAVETENTNGAYMLQVTMANDTVYELSSFAIADMNAADLCYEDEVAYLKYTSVSTGAEVSTKEQEETIKKEKDAAQPVIEQIKQIQTVSEDSGETLKAAREAYNALTDSQKEYVTNEAALRWREISLENLTIEEEEPDDTEYEEEEETDEDDFDYGADDYEEGQNTSGEGESESSIYDDWQDRYDERGNERRNNRDFWGDDDWD